MPEEAWAHSQREAMGGTVRCHRLDEHLKAVAAGAERFSLPPVQSWAALAGLWHDLGKYRPGFQQYIRSDSEAHIEGRLPAASDKTHSAAGALHALKGFEATFGRGAEKPARALAYVIAGHHAGLADWAQLSARLLGNGAAASGHEYAQALAACAAAAPELLRLPPDFNLRAACAAVPGITEGAQEPLALSLWIRMLFSALVDADFLDTEAFVDGARPSHRAGFPGVRELALALDAHLQALAAGVRASGRAGDPVMRERAQVLARCRASAAGARGVYSLMVPTGGGKTLASLAFALQHAVAHGMQRVVVAIPYTSIVEQTADVFAAIFGRGAFVEHHSQAEADERRETLRSRLACENWDAPLIVTTNVQLFESLFAVRTSRCRKLHNLAGSVIVLDEAQLLPPPFLQPILDALRLLVRHYGVTLLLCTATQPVLTESARFDSRQSLRGLPAPQPIINDPGALYAALQRVRFEWPTNWQAETPIPALAEALAAHEAVLAVVNTRSDAAQLVAALDAASGDATLHLSAAMCGQHRADIITTVRQRLAGRLDGTDRRPLRVVSTQLVEAGVDVDFPVVYRALAGLDSIAQAGGRCNREGRLGAAGGRVLVFVRPVPKMLAPLRHAAQATISALGEQRPAALLPADFERYFPLYYAAFPSRDQHDVVGDLRSNADFAFAFRTAADKFRLVDDGEQGSVVVPYEPVAGRSEAVTQALSALESGGAERWHLRALQRFVVQARQRDLNRWLARGSVIEPLPGWYVLKDELMYDHRLGLLRDGAVLDAASLVQ